MTDKVRLFIVVCYGPAASDNIEAVFFDEGNALAERDRLATAWPTFRFRVTSIYASDTEAK